MADETVSEPQGQDEMSDERREAQSAVDRVRKVGTSLAAQVYPAVRLAILELDARLGALEGRGMGGQEGDAAVLTFGVASAEGPGNEAPPMSVLLTPRASPVGPSESEREAGQETERLVQEFQNATLALNEELRGDTRDLREATARTNAARTALLKALSSVALQEAGPVQQERDADALELVEAYGEACSEVALAVAANESPRTVQRAIEKTLEAKAALLHALRAPPHQAGAEEQDADLLDKYIESVHEWNDAIDARDPDAADRSGDDMADLRHAVLLRMRAAAGPLVARGGQQEEQKPVAPDAGELATWLERMTELGEWMTRGPSNERRCKRIVEILRLASAAPRERGER